MEHHLATPDLLRFYSDLQARTSVAACSALFQEAVARFEIVAFACGEIDLAERTRNVMFIAEWPQAWIDYYVKSGFIERDPIVNALRVLSQGVFVRRYPARPALLAPGPRGLARCGGIRLEPGPGGPRRARRRALRARHHDRRRRCSSDPTQRAYLCLIGECLLVPYPRPLARRPNTRCRPPA